MMKISVSEKGKGKIYTFGFKDVNVDLSTLGEVANRNAISGPGYKDGHRKGENIIRGSNIILIDCDEPAQAEAVEEKLQYYDYVKAPSASNLEYDYKWHYIIPTQKPLSIYPAGYRWQVEQFFRQIGINDSMIDTSGSYDIARQFAPAIIKMSAEEADDLTYINNTELQAPIIENIPEEMKQKALKSISISVSAKTASKLPSEHLWYDGKPISYKEVIKGVREANKGDSVIVSGFGCPHNNKHSLDNRYGYGFAFINKRNEVTVKCSGNECKSKPYFTIPEKLRLETVEAPEVAIAEPINPTDFVRDVQAKVSEYQPSFVFGKSMLEAFYYFGAIYNESIYRNRNDLSPKRLNVPAPTGSSKSTSAKVYLSQISLIGHSGLLVVGKVSNAIEAVNEINEMAGKQVAVCIYKPTDKNPDNDARVEIKELHKYPIAVITHNMFLSRSSTLKDIDLIRKFDTNNREAVIIDEHIDFKRTVSFTSDEVLGAIELVKDIPHWDGIDKLFEDIGTIKPDTEIGTVRNEDISGLMTTHLHLLLDGRGYVGHLKDRKREDREAQDRAWIIDLMERIRFVFNSHNIVTSSGKYTTYSVNEDLTNKFGSAVILDATSNATPIYISHHINRDDLKLLKMPVGIRDYSNATLHICKDRNRKQSKGHIVKQSKVKGLLNEVIDSYLELLYPLVADGSKLLVATFMDIEELFRTRCKDDNISFIHWGEHEGTNAYSHYNKAAAIGWYRKSRTKYYEDLDAVLPDTGTYQSLTSTIATDVSAMIVGGLAADFVQFFNRTRSRVAIDDKGNCAKTDFYIFSDFSSDDPISIIIDEMPNIKTIEWKPVATYPIVKSTVAEQRAERIVKFLQKHKGHTISVKRLSEHFGFSKTKFTTTFKQEQFQLQLEEFDIHMRRVKGKGGGIYFDIPE